MQLAILGLGKMGGRLAEKILQGRHEVVVWNRSKDVVEQYKMKMGDYVVSQKLQVSHSIEGLIDKLLKPRVFWLMLPAGEATDDILSEIKEIAEPGDIVVDGGNANFKDTQKRYEELNNKGIKFLGIGVSGGVHALESGFCMMVGGHKDAYEYLKPVFDSLVAPEGGYNYFGEGGAGHFIKMVHNGIEYGMMQSIAEGFGVLAKSPYQLNLTDVGYIYQRGSIIRSFLLDMAVNAFVNDPDFINTEGFIDATGEGKWTVEQAAEEHVPAYAIKSALDFRSRTQYDKGARETFAAKLVAALRNQFGGHEIK